MVSLPGLLTILAAPEAPAGANPPDAEIHLETFHVAPLPSGGRPRSLAEYSLIPDRRAPCPDPALCPLHSCRPCAAFCLCDVDLHDLERRFPGSLPVRQGRGRAGAAGSRQAWRCLVGMHTFGASAPLTSLLTKFGFTPEAVAQLARQQVEANA